MKLTSLWIEGTTRSGKTTRLIEEFGRWVENKPYKPQNTSPIPSVTQNLASSVLVLSANDENRRELGDKLSLSVRGSYPILCKTLLGLIRDEVNLFWPLLFEELNLKAQFPLLLRPETEQTLATQLWRFQLDKYQESLSGSSESRFVRQTLDLLQLAGASGIRVEDIPYILEHGLGEGDGFLGQLNNSEGSLGNLGQLRGDLILEWQQWCLERGLLTYGLIYTLYWRYLLPHPQYQQHLISRYQAIFADDVDDYPAIAKDLFKFLLDQGAFGLFTYNPEGQIRLGLNADPQYLSQLASYCQVKILPNSSGIAKEYGELIVNLATDPLYITNLPDKFTSIQTISRAELLRKTANLIIKIIKTRQVNPEDIAIIAPGLDEIARYTLIEILSAADIPIKPLNEQRPLISFPIVQALLSLLGLTYPGLGQLIRTDDIAQMLTVLSQNSDQKNPAIDPVRSGLIADACYQINSEHPQLLPVEKYSRWDRLGNQATEDYKRICQWIEVTKNLVQQEQLTSPMIVLDKAIKQLIEVKIKLSYEQLSALRELTETSQHFWEIDRRLRQHDPNPKPQGETLIDFIQLLRKGTITANPRPIRYLGKQPGYVTLATIFQYRSLRRSHPWQFWLDTSSNLWEKGGASVLFCAPLFLREWSGRTLTPEDEFEADQARLKRILRDLLGRAEEKVILCHSDLSVKGTEQTGPLLTLVNGCQEVDLEEELIK
ncbi:recombinase family protein [Crocosphaera sp. UHCC 0190]|uniref:recombinase family protein n=1 Tax=Crocosphaera sp. UHCC 0190 TaxID=3110246 RepID=UPI002B1F27BB|nr:recombinase family protein [Crocosphaera sp. UHCC 0190]MEA5508971.1 recombinase family protein [Crocosphaera sp. UHCC 0190]